MKRKLRITNNYYENVYLVKTFKNKYLYNKSIQ